MSVFEQPAETVEAAAPGIVPMPSSGTATRPRPEEAPTGSAAEVVETASGMTVEIPKNVALGSQLSLNTFQRLTGIVGTLLLIAGLVVWRFKPHSQDRLALLILVCAMFLAILHHYSLEENRRGNTKSQQ